METLEAPAKVWTETDYRYFYGMLSYSDFVKNLAAGTLDSFQISR